MKIITPSEYGSNFHFRGRGLNPGGMQPPDGEILADLAYKWGGPVLEIGVEYGNSTYYIDQGLCARRPREPGYQIFSVDIQDVREVRFPHQVFAKAPSVCYDPGVECAWAFVDGDHSYDGVIADIEHCGWLGIPRLVFHDAREGDPTDGENGQKGTDVLRAVKRRLYDMDLTLITTPAGLLIAE